MPHLPNKPQNATTTPNTQLNSTQHSPKTAFNKDQAPFFVKALTLDIQ